MIESQSVVETGDNVRVAFEFSHHGAGVNMVDAGHPHPLGNHPETHAVVLLPGVRAVARSVQMQDHSVAAGPFGHGLNRGIANRQVDHHHDSAELASELGPLVHVLHRRGGHVQVVALDFAGLGLGPVDRLHAVEIAITPAHERLGVDVLVVLGEIQPAAQRLEHHPRP